MTSFEELKKDDLVINPKMPGWGPGRIFKVVPGRAYVVWRELPGREAKPMASAMLKLAPEQSDTVLDNLPPLIERDGKLVLPADRVTFQQAVDKFLNYFPLGFHDPKYLGDKRVGERDYKCKAHEDFVKSLGGNQLREKLDSNLQSVIREATHCIGMVNLLSPYEAAAFRDALRDESAARFYFTKLADLLEAETIQESQFTTYADAVCDLPAERGRVASWPVATILPYLAQPDRHMLLKPEITQKVAGVLGFHLNYRPEPNWLTYHCLLQMTGIYRQKLAHLEPRDHIDVQSFFWLICLD